MAKFSVEVTLTASVTYTVEVEASSESRAEDAATALWASQLPDDFQVNKGYITDYDAEVTRLSWACESCEIAITEDVSRRCDEMCAECFEIARHDDLIEAARRNRIPHSVIRTRACYMPTRSTWIQSDAAISPQWGYAKVYAC
jgi:hypothetical protein